MGENKEKPMRSFGELKDHWDKQEQGKENEVSPESINQSESAEQELSPEVIEKIMEKVQDIDKKGTAFSAIRFSKKRVETVLRQGFLGRDLDNTYEERFLEDWKETAKRRKALVHFNIVGRNDSLNLRRDQRGKREIGESHYMTSPRTLAIIFDVSGFKELTPRYMALGDRARIHLKDRPLLQSPQGTFRANDHEIDRKLEDFPDNTPIDNPELQEAMKNLAAKSSEWISHHFTDEGMPKPESEYGFVLSSRVSPRRFKGIVFRPGILTKSRAEIESELDKEEEDWKVKYPAEPFSREIHEGILENKYSEESDRPEIILDQAQQIARQTFIAVDGDPQRILPVYDVNGNLWWPKQMSYEEVKKFVAEREAKKSASDEKRAVGQNTENLQ